MSDADGRRRTVAADAFLVVGGLAVVASALHAPLRHRAYERRIADVLSDVEAVRETAEQYRDSAGHWPDDAGEGKVPDDLAALLPAGLDLHAPGYVLGWSRWDVVVPAAPAEPREQRREQPPNAILAPGGPGKPPPGADTVGTRPPPVAELGGITVRSGEESILGALLEHYGSAASFVRDSTWTFVLGPPRVP